jgi:NAD(P)-dependent dehydrogenase (short-subunit alcohol dehydrogenase family)
MPAPSSSTFTNQASIAAAAERVRNEFGRLDVLVNNAGISHAGNSGKSLEEIVKSGRASVGSLDDVGAVFETNVFGVIAVTQAMLPLLREAPAARIVSVSSSTGSLTRNSDPTNPHRSMFGAYSWSKTALNAITLGFALDLESTGIKVNAACPGFTATDLNNFQGTRTGFWQIPAISGGTGEMCFPRREKAGIQAKWRLRMPRSWMRSTHCFRKNRSAT